MWHSQEPCATSLFSHLFRCEVTLCSKPGSGSDWRSYKPLPGQVQPLHPTYRSLLCLPITCFSASYLWHTGWMHWLCVQNKVKHTEQCKYIKFFKALWLKCVLIMIRILFHALLLLKSHHLYRASRQLCHLFLKNTRKLTTWEYLYMLKSTVWSNLYMSVSYLFGYDDDNEIECFFLYISPNSRINPDISCVFVFC